MTSSLNRGGTVAVCHPLYVDLSFLMTKSTILIDDFNLWQALKDRLVIRKGKM